MTRTPPASERHASASTRKRLDPSGLPSFLNLFAIRFPIGAIASIGHRLSGVCLLLGLLFVPSVLAMSLHSEGDYDALLATWHSPWAAPLEFLILWAFSFHVLAGVRHLLMDVGVGSELGTARASARVVLVLGFLAAVSLLVTRRWL